ncbi:5-oxoprolinase subunit PxpB [Methylobacterium persicinum]|uniref:KipI family sensor histidine kinase inhibitor n=1 Tax=Methylobacterium persicinum TaxID=374426 RepID=A0ABU0HM44_9HYPH|nr:5-oxoprolinase subunit PxpB [Methylobacterium persicinum]MDQ0443408.1 KipI family sensor histidine kinase inhibitor [Methylobacterium persicinum]GJE38668.1 5-oxoprolinase subunit B [Methylobacterium persicinum]
MSEPAYRLLDCGDRALTVELGRAVDPVINAQVVALDEAIRGAGRPGLLETVPTYRSLLVLYDPDRLPRADLVALIATHWPPPVTRAGAVRRWRVPVLYGGEHGADLASLAAAAGLSEAEVIGLHAGCDYRVHMIGFAPGFAYLGGLDPRIHASRRTDPRPRIPAGSVSIGGNQTGVSPPLELPSGWQLIGQTPARSYDPARAEPFLFAAGDLIRFEPIGHAAFDAMSAAALAGETVATMERIDG